MAANSDSKIVPKVIHAARIQPGGTVRYLLLKKMDPHTFAWVKLVNQDEVETPVSALSFQEAMQQARKQWKNISFRTLNCGFRYTLPERDEHGGNALFHQMVSSYSSSNGVYFDDELGHNCFVNFASTEARELWQKLKNEGRL